MREAVNLTTQTIRKPNGKKYSYWVLRWFGTDSKQRGKHIGSTKKLSKRQAEKIRRAKEMELFKRPGRRNVSRAETLGEFLKTYFEAYWVVLKVLQTYNKRDLVKKERLKKIRATGNQLHKQQEIERSEALSQINYENGLTFFNFKGIKGAEDKEEIEFYTGVIQKYLGCFAVHK